MKPTYVVAMVRLNAGNDRNGNPRRVFVALNAFGGACGAWDEGYQGRGCVPESLRELAAQAPTFDGSASDRVGLLGSAAPDPAERFVDVSARIRRNLLYSGNPSGRRPRVRQ